MTSDTKKYKIYKLVHPTEGVVYIGQTIQTLKRRKNSGYKYNPELHKISNECDIVLIEETDDVSRERYWINQYDGLKNIRKGNGLDIKEWVESNNEKLKDYKKEWYELNKDKLKFKNKSYNEVNKEKIKQKRKEWYELNKDIQKAKMKDYYQLNKNK